MKKNLLIITQKVDRKDPVLGFFHTWIKEFSKHNETLNVICLEQGDYDLPHNVHVFSLGKERGVSKVRYVINLFRLLWRLRREYTGVFVHMNQEYVLLAGLFWRLFGKRILLWRNHPQGTFLTRVAVFLSHCVYCTSENSFTKKFQKTKKMPVGIIVPDQQFVFDRKEKTLLSLGRISPVKHIETILETYTYLQKKYPDAQLSIVGNPSKNGIDEQYLNLLKDTAEKISSGQITFLPAVSPEKTKEFYQSHQVFINATTPGSFDKTTLEAVTYGAVSFVCQNIWKGTPFVHLADHFYFPFKESDRLAERAVLFFEKTKEEQKGLQEDFLKFVKEHHSLDLLVKQVFSDL